MLTINIIYYFLRQYDLYEAYNNLEESEIQVSNLVPYVGRENAPAASAILYSTVGSGRVFNALRKNISQLFKFR